MPTQGVDLGLSPAALLQRCSREPYAFLLDGGTPASWVDGIARLGFAPRATLRLGGDRRAVVHDSQGQSTWDGDPYDLLERFRQSYTDTGSDFGGIVVAALSYDLGGTVERVRLRRRPPDEALLLFAAAYDWVLEYSYRDDRFALKVRPDCVRPAPAIAALLRSRAGAPQPRSPTSTRPPKPELPKRAHVEAVERALDHIGAGDIYQVNLAQRFVSQAPPVPSVAFAELLRRHPTPFSACFDCGELALVSNWPECLLDSDGDRIATYPIKGTRPRGLDAGSDRAQIEALVSDEKERAEHVMIVDLERNDLGRICRAGSVQVDELMQVASFGSLHHLVSKVSGRLSPTSAIPAVLRALFPGGSITGAPKIRAMEIIDELEPVERGFYTGAIGFLCGQRATFNITIRTAIVTSDRLLYYAGGGIVADSTPEREYEETLLKAQPFLSLLAASAV